MLLTTPPCLKELDLVPIFQQPWPLLTLPMVDNPMPSSLPYGLLSRVPEDLGLFHVLLS